MNVCNVICKKIQDLQHEMLNSDTDRLTVMEKGLSEIIRGAMQQLAQALLDSTLPQLTHGNLPCSCGSNARFVSERSITLQTLVGKVDVRQTYFQCRQCKNSITPEEELYSLTGRRYSRQALERIVLQGALQGSFEQAARELCREGIKVSRESVRTLTESAATRMNMDSSRNLFFQSKAAPSLPGRMYVSCDGLKVNTHAGWRELKLGAVYDEDKMQRIYVCRIGGPSELGGMLRNAVSSMGIKQCKDVVVIGDGALWVQGIHELHFPGSRFVLDFYHAMEHVAYCAESMFGEGVKQTRQWRERVRDMLLDGGGRRVCSYIRRLRPHVKGKCTGALDALYNYLAPREEFTQYPQYKKDNLDIGSGLIESGCKTVIAERLKRSGMRWRVINAEAMGFLRCVIFSLTEKEFDALFSMLN